MPARSMTPGTSSGTSGATTTGALRVLRATVVGTCALLIGYGGHVAAGGAPLPAGELALLCTGAGGAAWVASARQWTFPALFSALTLFQLVVHVWLTGLADLASPMAAMPGMPSSPWLMVGTHLAAALVTATLLRNAESCLTGLVGALRSRTWTPAWFCAVPVTQLAWSGEAATGQVAALVSQWRAAGLPSRGPPAPA